MLLLCSFVAFILSQRGGKHVSNVPRHGKCGKGKETSSHGMQAIIHQAEGMRMACASVVST